MHTSKLGGAAALAAGVALAVPAAGLAAHAISPKDGNYKGKGHYKVAGKRQTADVSLTFNNHAIRSVTLMAQKPPLDRKHSHGQLCGAANDYDTTGYTESGHFSPATGRFSYTFTHKTKNTSDKITLKGRFTDDSHATGTWHDVTHLNFGGSSSLCDSGGVKFKVAHA